MRIMEILPNNEIKRFKSTPIISNDDKKHYFKVDSIIAGLLKNVKMEHNKIGLVLSYGYFKVSGKFYSQEMFKIADINFVTKMLGIQPSKDLISKYKDRTRQKHRKLILGSCGYIEFDASNNPFESVVDDLVKSQMNPRKLFYVLIDTLRNKKTEIPSYDKIARTITGKFNTFENTILKTIASIITPEQEEALNQLTKTTEEHYQRPLLIRLKIITQSIRPSQIKYGIHNFLIIKKLFQEVQPIIGALSLSTEATRYYAKWVTKAKITQITDIAERHKKCLYLIAFIDHCYKMWQDTLIDMLLKCVQAQLNKADKELSIRINEKLPNKNKLVNSVLSGFNANQETVQKIKKILHNNALNNDEKIKKLYKIVPDGENKPLLIQSANDADKLKEELDHEKDNGDQFDILEKFSRKLQNRVADIIKHVELETDNEKDGLYLALIFYQTEKNITQTAPSDFLDDHEYKAVYEKGKFNISLYKSILFCKISNAIKSGKISLSHSYRYLPIDKYLIDEKEWQNNKKDLLEKYGLSHFSDVGSVLETLKSQLNQRYIDVNKRIISEENKYVKIKKDGNFSLYTPPIEKPDYDSISAIIGADRYVPILQMMAEMNSLSKFTENFKHHKIKGSKAKPNNETFYAGIFALGSNIGLHKLANTAVGINYNTLSNAVNWYFSLENLHMVNQTLTNFMAKLSLPNQFKREKELLHTSSDGQKQCVSVESLNANYSYKYHGNAQGINIYRFIDERGILFYSSVFSSSERDAAFVIDGLLHNENIQSDMHSTDTHGYTEMIFAVSHLMGVTFAPRIKNIASIQLVNFNKIDGQSSNPNEYPIKPDYYVRANKIERNWDNILRFIVTIMQRNHRASTILKRLSSYTNQHPLQEALKEFGRIIKSVFVLNYIDDVALRQAIEKQLNKGELANKFASAVSFSSDEINEAYQENQEIHAMCKTIIQNIIILWNYVELTKIIMRSDGEAKIALLENIRSASILTWRHVNLYGLYDFTNILVANDNRHYLDEVINYKVA